MNVMTGGFARRACLARKGLLPVAVLLVSLSVRVLDSGAFPVPSTQVDDAAIGAAVQEAGIAPGSTGLLHAVWSISSPPYEIRYQNSTSKGLFWNGSQVVISGGTDVVNSPRIAVDTSATASDGFVFAMCMRMQSSVQALLVARSVDRGATWEPTPYVVDSANLPTSNLNTPQITVDDSGTVLAVFTRSNAGTTGIYANRSTDSGQTWGVAQRIDDQTSGANSSPSIATSGANVLVCYKVLDASAYRVVRSPDRGQTWSLPVLAAPCNDGGRRRSHLVVDPLTGRVHLVFEAPSNAIGLVYSDDAGQSWSSQVRIDDDTTGALKQAPVLTGDGAVIHAFWSDYRNGDTDIFHSSSSDNGLTWGDGQPDSDDRVDDTDINSDPQDDASAQLWPQAAMVPGRVCVLWRDDRQLASSGMTRVYANGDYLPVVTEFRDEPAADQLIELYNPGSNSFDLSLLSLRIDNQPEIQLSGALPPLTSWTVGPASANPSPDLVQILNLTPDSGSLVLLGPNGSAASSFHYGANGTVPDPEPGGSSARYYSAADAAYTDEWSFQDPPTFGILNTGAGENPSPPVVLNEVLFNPSAPQQMYIELICVSGTPVDITGYRILTDRAHIIGSKTISPSDPYYFVHAQDDPNLFTDLSASADNVYLFDASGNLLDRVGWTSAHTQGRSVARYPEGQGGHFGRDDETSEQAGWVFDQPLSVPAVFVREDQTLYADLGQSLVFPLTITNAQDSDDIIEIDIQPRLGAGWTATAYDELTVSPLTDTLNPDGRPDVLVSANGSLNFTVKVDLPAVPSTAPREILDVWIESADTPFFTNSAVLTANANTYLWADKTIDPDLIQIEGTGFDEQATITLSVIAGGYPVPADDPIDAVFLMDTSASMSDQAIAQAKETLKRFFDQLKAQDRAAIVEFKNTAWLVDALGLTADKNLLKGAANNIGASGGVTNLAEAIKAGTAELTANGDPARMWFQVLVTDGARDYSQTMAEASNAAGNNIAIYPVGYGQYVSHSLLRDIADITGGLYCYAPGIPDIQGCFDEVATQILLDWIAGRDGDPGDASPMVRDVLPVDVHYVDGSALDPDSLTPLDPDRMYIDGSAQTVLEWNVPLVPALSSWNVAFDVTSALAGLQLADVVALSRVEYTSSRNVTETVLFPETWVTVITDSTECPRGTPRRITDLVLVRSGQDLLASWTPDLRAEGGYNIYNNDVEENIPLLRSPAFTPVASLVGVPFTLVNAGVSGLRYYQVLGVCQDLQTEGP